MFSYELASFFLASMEEKQPNLAFIFSVLAFVDFKVWMLRSGKLNDWFLLSNVRGRRENSETIQKSVTIEILSCTRVIYLCAQVSKIWRFSCIWLEFWELMFWLLTIRTYNGHIGVFGPHEQYLKLWIR